MANEFKVKKGLVVDGSGTVLDVQGTQGQLFSVTDSLTGDLFSVSDISGIPILNVNSSGLVTVDGSLRLDDSNKIQLGDSQDLELYHDGSNSYVVDNGTGSLRLNAAGASRLQVGSDVHILGGTDFAIAAGRKLYLDGQSNTYITESSADNIKFFTGGAEVLLLDSSQNATLAGNLELGVYASTVQGVLKLNGSTANKQSVIKTTDGNLHIDAASGNAIYLNWYGGTQGTQFGDGSGASGASVSAGGVYTATGGTSTQWNTAYGWGNHASGGYAASSHTHSNYITSNAADTFTSTLTMGTQQALVANNYGRGVYGLYSASRYQHVWSMGAAYSLSDDGTGTGDLYGLAFTHTNVGGQSKSGLAHQLLIMDNGVTKSAIGRGVWTDGIVTATGGNSTEWNTAYDKTLQWDGGATALVAATGRTSLGLGSAATTASTAYATSAQGTLATNALPKAGGTMTGALTGTAATFSNDITLAGTFRPTNGIITTGANYITLNTPSGNIQIGAMNTSYAHIYSDRPKFYFNKTILINGNEVWDRGDLASPAQTNVANNFTQIQKTTLSEPKLQLQSNSSPSLMAGLHTQVGGQLLGYGTNFSQIGSRNTSYPGGFFRIDVRSGYESQFFTVQRVTSTSTETILLTVNSTGDLTATGSLAENSDERLKSDIKTVDSALDKINALRGVTYIKNGKRGLGVIAQEVEKVLPEVVIDGAEYKSVAYGNIVSVLIEAVKEQDLKIKRLEELVELMLKDK